MFVFHVHIHSSDDLLVLGQPYDCSSTSKADPYGMGKVDFIKPWQETLKANRVHNVFEVMYIYILSNIKEEILNQDAVRVIEYDALNARKTG